MTGSRVIGALREALAYVYGPPDISHPRPLESLEIDLSTMHALLQQTRHAKLGALLSALDAD